MSSPKKDDKQQEPASEPESGTMSFWEHLDELRGRLVKIVLAALLGGGVAWYYKKPLLTWLTKPLVDGWKGDSGVTLHFGTPAALFLAYLKLAVLAGLILALPIIFYQLWAFVAPGLYSKEKRLAAPFVASSTVLFVGGAYFGWRFAFPMAFQYLLGFSGQVGAVTLTPTIMIGDYLDFVARLLLAFGAAFELPVVVFFLAFAGVVTHKQLLKFSRYFIVLAFFISAIITPPDVMSQFLLAVPLCVLYYFSILIAWMVQRKKPLPSAT